MANLKNENYAVVTWQAHDIKEIKPHWTLEQCEEWLIDNESRIEDRLIELGCEVLDSFLCMEPESESV